MASIFPSRTSAIAQLEKSLNAILLAIGDYVTFNGQTRALSLAPLSFTTNEDARRLLEESKDKFTLCCDALEIAIIRAKCILRREITLSIKVPDPPQISESADVSIDNRADSVAMYETIETEKESLFNENGFSERGQNIPDDSFPKKIIEVDDKVRDDTIIIDSDEDDNKHENMEKMEEKDKQVGQRRGLGEGGELDDDDLGEWGNEEFDDLFGTMEENNRSRDGNDRDEWREFR